MTYDKNNIYAKIIRVEIPQKPTEKIYAIYSLIF